MCIEETRYYMMRLFCFADKAVHVIPAPCTVGRRFLSSHYQEARNVKMGETRSMNGIDATVRNVRDCLRRVGWP